MKRIIHFISAAVLIIHAFPAFAQEESETQPQKPAAAGMKYQNIIKALAK